MKASEFKARCLKLMDEVAETGQPIVILKHGKPVSQLSPYVKKPDTLFGALKGSVRIKGDITAPIGVKWKAQQ